MISSVSCVSGEKCGVGSGLNMGKDGALGEGGQEASVPQGTSEGSCLEQWEGSSGLRKEDI